VNDQPLLIWIPAQLPARAREPVIVPSARPVDPATLARTLDGLKRLP
jgi:hypothetical protein